MNLTYEQRAIFYGNEALLLGDLVVQDGVVSVTNTEIVTGLVSVGSMEDQAEVNNYPADNVPDHGMKKGATLLQGEMVFIQDSKALKESWLGHVATANGLGFAQTGDWKTKIVQYLIKGRRRTPEGGFENGWKIEVYPAMTPTAEPTKESETESTDGADPIQWTLAVQAVDSPLYKVANQGKPFVEYEVWGAQAEAFASKMETGLFIMMPDTVIEGGIGTLTAPTIDDVETATKGGNDGTLVIPTKLKNQANEDVAVTSTIKDAQGQTATNGQLAPNTYTITFKASGYPDVTATATVTDKA